jgi:redox-sensitive bicupin YhaK (pirin superfamily)
VIRQICFLCAGVSNPVVVLQKGCIVLLGRKRKSLNGKGGRMERIVTKVLKSKQTLEGAGVRLKRVFDGDEVRLFDPFLLLDHFGSDDPEDYIKGFPWHPHRGIETVTYMFTGEVEHGDSMGNKGVIKSGDVQWMTAGSGIIHQEMPKRYEGLMQGFQLWVNLPAKKKMMAPRYRGITGDQIPSLEKDGANIKVIAGSIDAIEGPVRDLVVDVEYSDVQLKSGSRFEHPTDTGLTVFAYVINGAILAGDALVKQENCALFGKGDQVNIIAKERARFLFVTGKPLNEPIVWGGPIVMNTEAELARAYEDLERGTFVKNGGTIKPSKNFYRD